jgi:hypothetical protein
MASERGKEVEQSSVVTKEGRKDGREPKNDRKIKTLYEADVIKATNKML